MSHELRTPLTGVLGLAEVMQQDIYGDLTEKQRQALPLIQASGEHLLQLINDILDLSKLEAGTVALQIAPVSIGEVCQATLELVKQTAHQKNLSLIFRSDTRACRVQADGRRLKQMLVNLLSNAVKFTPEGGQVGLEVAGDEARQQVHNIIWDTGIAPEHQALLSQPFMQIDGSLARKYEGAGLGLALTYGIKSSPLRDCAGRVISHILIFHDITGQVREIRERREADAPIQASLREKEVLLIEIHHRVKNNLQIISSLLQLQTSQLYHLDAQAALRDSQYRVRSMDLIRGKLYQSKDLAQVNLGDYIRSLSVQMLRSYKGNGRVELILEVEAVLLGIDLAVPCGLILNELISNAHKHAFPPDRSGQVVITLHAGPGPDARLRAADNGVGLPPSVDLRTTPSLGLMLVSNLVEQLQGKVALDRTQGTAFEISFPFE